MKNRIAPARRISKGGLDSRRVPSCTQSALQRIMISTSTGRQRWVATALVAISFAPHTYGVPDRSAPPNKVNLTGGQIKIDLTSGVNNPSYTFTNGTAQPICDLELSTNDSDWIDPDFEGDIVVRTSPAGTDLGWTETPAPGDGVEDIRTEAPGIPGDLSKCVAVGSDFSVSIIFDDVGGGDMLWVAPTNADTCQILKARGVQKVSRDHRLFNGYEGLQGSTDGCVVATNALNIPVSQIAFESLTDGVTVTSVTSSRPSTFDPGTGILEFDIPVDPGEPLDYGLHIDQLALYVVGDRDPFTIVKETVIAGPLIVGACCDESTACTEDVTQSECNGTWYPLDTCETVTCESPGTGACYVGIACETALHLSECDALGGKYVGDDTSCVDTRYTDIIPAVSEWGLAVMLLLTLTAGTVILSRRRVRTS